MASRIQGITVEIGGDTTKLSKALESVNKSIKGTQSGLKDVNKLLKLDPSNTELVVQNQKMLKDAIEATKEKLASPFSCLNNFYFKILSSFLGSLHFRYGLFVVLLFSGVTVRGSGGGTGWGCCPSTF